MRDGLPETDRWSDLVEAVIDYGVGRPFSHLNILPKLPARRAPRLFLYLQPSR